MFDKDIPCVRRRTFLMFEEGHLLCSKQDISCVRSRTSRVFQAGHLLCSKQDMSCAPRTKKRFSSKHIDHTPLNSSFFELDFLRPMMPWFRVMLYFWPLCWLHTEMSNRAKSSNGQKVARIALISTICLPKSTASTRSKFRKKIARRARHRRRCRRRRE